MPKILRDIAEVVMGFSPTGKTCNTVGAGTPLLNGPTEFGPHHPAPVQFTTDPRRLAEPDDILFCVRGSTTGRMNWSDQRYAIGRGIAAIRHRGGQQYQPYVRACIEHALPNLLGFATGSTFPSLSRQDIERMPVHDLTLNVQTQIARILGDIDDKIEQNRRTSRALERRGRAVFRAWFVDFEPVHAKAAGATYFPSMPQSVFDSLPTAFTPSELGPIPEGWDVGKLGDVSTEHREQVKPKDVDPETPYIGLEHMPRRSVTLSEWGHAGKVTSGKLRFRRRQILFGKLRPYFHKVGIAPLDGVCSTDIVVFQPTSPEWFSFLLEHASSDDFVSYTNACSTGTKMPRTNWRDMSRYQIAKPPIELAECFDDIVSPMFDWILAAVFENRKLAELRDYLLPKLLSGEVRVRDAQQAAAKAV